MRVGVAGSLFFPLAAYGGAGKMYRDCSRQEAIAANDQEGVHTKTS